MIIMGLFFLGQGGRFPTTSFLLFTTLAVGNFLLFGTYIYLLPSTYMPMWSVYIFAPVCFAMGGGLGYGAAKWPRIGITVISFTIGSIFASMIKSAVGPGIQLNSVGFLVDWAIVVASGLLVACICIFLFDYAVILGSGVCGAYLLIRVSFSFY